MARRDGRLVLRCPRITGSGGRLGTLSLDDAAGPQVLARPCSGTVDRA